MSLYNRKIILLVRLLCIGGFIFSFLATLNAENEKATLHFSKRKNTKSLIYQSTISSFSLVQDSPTTSPNLPANKLVKEKKKRKLSKPWRAAILSMVVPGLGQLVYAKGYIRAPVYWTLLSFIALGMVQEWNNFQNTSFAYNAHIKISNYKDSTDFYAINEELKNIPQSTLRNLKSEYRKQFDENLIYFVLVYIAQVIDAGVFTHLQSFDISDNLSMRIDLAKPPLNYSFSLSRHPLSAFQPKLTFSFKHKKHKLHALYRK